MIMICSLSTIIVKVEVRLIVFFWNHDHHIQKHDFEKNAFKILKHFSTSISLFSVRNENDDQKEMKLCSISIQFLSIG